MKLVENCYGYMQTVNKRSGWRDDRRLKLCPVKMMFIFSKHKQLEVISYMFRSSYLLEAQGCDGSSISFLLLFFRYSC